MASDALSNILASRSPVRVGPEIRGQVRLLPVFFWRISFEGTREDAGNGLVGFYFVNVRRLHSNGTTMCRAGWWWCPVPG